jgi:hypothetical protein
VCRAGTNSVDAQTARLSENVAPLGGFYRGGSGILTSHRQFDGSQKQLACKAGGKIRRTHSCARAE